MNTVAKYISGVFAFAIFAASTACCAPRIFVASDYGASGDGTTLDTSSIQKAIDAAAAVGGIITFKPGTYLTGSLFFKSGVTLDLPEGALLIGSQKLEDYPMLPTRIAGIEMTWPSALINVRGQDDVKLTGKGSIDGDGPFWWKQYWNLRARYESRGLRWAADYDARRPRLVLIQDSQGNRRQNSIHRERLSQCPTGRLPPRSS